MARTDFLFVLLIFILVLIMRLWTAADKDVLYSYDSGNIVLAVQNYNISEERPHLPGYYLYVQTVRLVNNFTSNSQRSIILLMSIFSALGCSLFYLLLRIYYDKKISIIVTAVIATNPLLWFFGSVTEIYSFDLFFSVLFVLTGRSRKHIFWLSLIFAIGAGIRQSSAVILFPLYIYFWWSYLKQTKTYTVFWLSNLSGAVILFAWFMPMVASTGSFAEYLELYLAQSPIPRVKIEKNILQLLMMGLWIFVPLIFLWVVKVVHKDMLNMSKELKRILLVWIVPAALMFVFVHYTRGYLLIVVAGLALLLAAMSKRSFGRISLISWIVLQCGYFLFMPFTLERADIFYVPERRQISKVEVLADRFLSQNSLTLAHIREMDKMTKVIAAVAKENSQYKYILFDPSVLVNTRTLQATIPKAAFAELNLVRPDSYFLYKDMKQYNFIGRGKLLDSALIVGFKPFIINFASMIDIKKQSGNLVFYFCPNDKNHELRKIYNKYFQKSKN